MERMHWQDGVTLVAGIVLVVALFVLNVSAPEGQSLTLVTWNFVAVGALTAITALGALVAFKQWEEWIAMVLGGWMIISPWILGFSDIPLLMWTAVICGVVIVAMGLTVLISPDDKSRI
ncbi:hypothetical protein HKCCE3408_06070 [Rhodobacterales bacterium HKCCE3408]|nr:hypothetical protein [Rhodobacterales bacterium HKCCE3408]